MTVPHSTSKITRKYSTVHEVHAPKTITELHPGSTSVQRRHRADASPLAADVGLCVPVVAKMCRLRAEQFSALFSAIVNAGPEKTHDVAPESSYWLRSLKERRKLLFSRHHPFSACATFTTLGVASVRLLVITDSYIALAC